MRVAYLSGPMTGYENYNYAAFESAAKLLRETDEWYIISPHENDRGSTHNKRSYYLRMDYTTLVHGKVDEYDGRLKVPEYVIVLPGWESSAGCNMELQIAKDLELPIHEYIEKDGYFTLPEMTTPICGAVKREAPNAAVKDDQGKLRYDLIPIQPLAELARVYTIGAVKYSDRNWEKGCDWGRIYGALIRHATAFWGGESIDKDNGQHHLASVAWNAFALMYFEANKKGKDDRVCQKP